MPASRFVHGARRPRAPTAAQGPLGVIWSAQGPRSGPNGAVQAQTKNGPSSNCIDCGPLQVLILSRGSMAGFAHTQAGRANASWPKRRRAVLGAGQPRRGGLANAGVRNLKCAHGCSESPRLSRATARAPLPEAASEELRSGSVGQNGTGAHRPSRSRNGSALKWRKWEQPRNASSGTQLAFMKGYACIAVPRQFELRTRM